MVVSEENDTMSNGTHLFDTRPLRMIEIGRTVHNIDTWGKDWKTLPKMQIIAWNEDGDCMTHVIQFTWEIWSSKVEKVIGARLTQLSFEWDHVEVRKIRGEMTEEGKAKWING